MTAKFGELLRAARLAKMCDQAEVADVIGRSVSFYSALEVGRKHPSPATLNVLCEYFDLSEIDAKRLCSAAAKSISEVRISTGGASAEAQEVALKFARSFESLDLSQIEKLQELLNE